VSRPWAFVCDYVKVLPTGKVKEVEIGGGASQGGEAGMGVGVMSSAGPGGGKGKEVEGPEAKSAASAVSGPVLSMNITELMAQGPRSTPKAWEALADLRDNIANGEKIDWWVIYNGDPERPFDGDSGYDEEEDDDVVDEKGEEVYEHQQPNTKTFVPRAEAIRPRSAPSPALHAQAQAQAQAQAPQVPRSLKSQGMPPPPVPPAKPREGGKRTPGMRAFPPLEKQMSPPPAPAPVVKPVTKTEGGLKKKFFRMR
jgi:hypothetical protein